MTDGIASMARELLVSAQKELDDKNFAKASELLDIGIAQLGDSYIGIDTIDDSSLKLTLSNASQRDGNLEQAANLKKSVLTARLDMYKKKIGCKEN